MSEIKKAPGVAAQAQSECTTILQDKPEDVKMRSVEEIRAEIARLEAKLAATPDGSFKWYKRLWALKWVLMENK